jgi:hypothetical protein
MEILVSCKHLRKHTHNKKRTNTTTLNKKNKNEKIIQQLQHEINLKIYYHITGHS